MTTERCKEHNYTNYGCEYDWCIECGALDFGAQTPRLPRIATEERPNHGLTPAQHELLTKLAEEAAEVIHMVMKNFLYGLLEVNELNPGGPNNLQRLEKEIGDFSCIVGLLVEKGVLSPAEIALHSAEKRKTIGKWLRHNKIGTDGSLA